MSANWVVSTGRIQSILNALSNLEERTTIRDAVINTTVYGEGGAIEVRAESDGHGGWLLTFDLESARAAS